MRGRKRHSGGRGREERGGEERGGEERRDGDTKEEACALQIIFHLLVHFSLFFSLISNTKRRKGEGKRKRTALRREFGLQIRDPRTLHTFNRFL